MAATIWALFRFKGQRLLKLWPKRLHVQNSQGLLDLMSNDAFSDLLLSLE